LRVLGAALVRTDSATTNTVWSIRHYDDFALPINELVRTLERRGVDGRVERWEPPKPRADPVLPIVCHIRPLGPYRFVIFVPITAAGCR
jgi:hypothetical protein